MTMSQGHDNHPTNIQFQALRDARHPFGVAAMRNATNISDKVYLPKNRAITDASACSAACPVSAKDLFCGLMQI